MDPLDLRPHGRGGLTLACGLLPVALRADVRRLYAVFRRLDDLVDDREPGAAKAVVAVHEWADGGPPASPESRVLQHLAERHPLPRAAIADFCAGMRHDLVGAPIRTEADLDEYCYRVAGTVGVVMTALLGTRAACAAEAAALGVGLQRTNVLRDVAEDRRAGRSYLARETLERFRGDWPGLVRDQVARADSWYDAGLPGIPRLRRGRLTVTAAATTYREILRRIERDPEAVLRERIVVPGPRKLAVIAGAAIPTVPPRTQPASTSES